VKCRCCNSDANQIFVDLGTQPPSNNYLSRKQVLEARAGKQSSAEPEFPLVVYVCHKCWLVQLPMHASSQQLFTESYAYFSSTSSTWVEHARRYVASMVERFSLNSDSFVVEVASNDGYLLQFVNQQGIPCLGIEPTHSTAAAARAKGIETTEEFFGRSFAKSLTQDRGQADLLIGNNVLAHVPDLNDFVEGVATALSPDGVATFEFPHLMQLVGGKQFDTIYHEHYSYLALHTVKRLFHNHGLRVFDVEQLSTHGGSIRVFATPASSSKNQTSGRVAELLYRESEAGMQTTEYYANFQPQVETIKHDLLNFLETCRANGESVCGYGAAAKGNTLLNYAGVDQALLPFVCDAAESKQGKFLPGSHIPILAPKELVRFAPDHVLILPWNIADEVVAQQSQRLGAKTKFHIAVPQMKLLSNPKANKNRSHMAPALARNRN
jgi:SAM-dependent methyltransferase